MTRRERYLGRSGVMRHNMGMPLVRLQPVSEPGRNEVMRWLRLIEDDPWYRISPVPVFTACFLELMGRSESGRNTLREARDGRPGGGSGRRTGNHFTVLGAGLAAQVAGLMKEIAEGRLVFTDKPWTAFRLTPPAKMPLAQGPFVLRADYNWWARCRACQGRRFAPVTIYGCNHVVCFDCMPPHAYASLGAKPSTHSLIPDAIERWHHGSSETGAAST
jgi:hypothetical protein